MAGTVPEGIGIVFQDDASFPWLTVRDNIAFGLKRAGIEMDRKVLAAIAYDDPDSFAGIVKKVQAALA